MAVDRLTQTFDHPLSIARASRDAGEVVIAGSWPTLPKEIIEAAGARPLTLRLPSSTAPDAVTWLEPGVFSPRIRALLHHATRGEFGSLGALVFPRTSEQDYKGYLYLREWRRQERLRGTPGSTADAPRIELLDLLQSESRAAAAYSLDRVRAFAAMVASVTGASVDERRLSAAIVIANRARAAARAVAALRQPPARVKGTTVFPVLAAFWILGSAEYAQLAAQALEELATGQVLAGPRMLIAGAPVDHAVLHRAIEAHGAVVVAEETPWTQYASAGALEASGDPFAAVAAYYRRMSSARLPRDRATSWFEQTVVREEVDAVVFTLPPEDSVYGWDYPARRQWLDARGVPHLLVRDDPGSPRQRDDDLTAFVTMVKPDPLRRTSVPSADVRG